MGSIHRLGTAWRVTIPDGAKRRQGCSGRRGQGGTKVDQKACPKACSGRRLWGRQACNARRHSDFVPLALTRTKGGGPCPLNYLANRHGQSAASRWCRLATASVGLLPATPRGVEPVEPDTTGRGWGGFHLRPVLWVETDYPLPLTPCPLLPALLAELEDPIRRVGELDRLIFVEAVENLFGYAVGGGAAPADRAQVSQRQKHA